MKVYLKLTEFLLKMKIILNLIQAKNRMVSHFEKYEKGKEDEELMERKKTLNDDIYIIKQTNILYKTPDKNNDEHKEQEEYKAEIESSN